ncbi:thermonuclease family protein [Spongiibacter nanhainus]|uniref:Thermonuclease family protein n=1 Tax=Spongiibacter nanhainus TaxID=2794344 RepID=A0A7T4UQA1_9GAMM|nr:thermonuclease family protein [Spongiibacter nanhainus]QQD18543.1 thermonuclease family protein [Spongiibacter nanhainus]
MLATASARAACPLPNNTEPVRIASVVDGDSLRLVSGERLRLVNINAAEMNDRGDKLVLARRARRFVAEQLAKAESVVIKRYGHDPYNRTLAEVFVDGRHLGETLLAEGLAWRIAVPPAVNTDSCLTRAEAGARQAVRGLWALAPLPSLKAGKADQGFAVIRGRVESVTAAGTSLWIDLDGDVVLRLADKDRRYFASVGDSAVPRVGQFLEVRGWLRHRRPPRPGFASLVMDLRHPLMMTAVHKNEAR